MMKHKHRRYNNQCVHCEFVRQCVKLKRFTIDYNNRRSEHPETHAFGRTLSNGNERAVGSEYAPYRKQ